MADLHITNGDGAGNILKASAIDGDVLPWRDIMHHGPFPSGLDLDQLSALRAEFYAGPGLDLEELKRDFRQRDDRLRASPTYDRVVLWFEHDLLDQLQILQLLDWFAGATLGGTPLDLICIDRFCGVDPFRGLGQLDPEQIASLYRRRHPVTADQLSLAQVGWATFRSADPNDLLSFLQGDLAALPFLQAALLRHVEEYPSYRTGLTRTEQQILELVAKGVSAPGRLFVENMEIETALFIGDWTTFSHIERLSSSKTPLLASAPHEKFLMPPHHQIPPQSFRNQRLTLTRAGERLLAGEIDAFDLINRDEWLGGVHLSSDRPIWTWDADCRSLKMKEPEP